MPDDTDYEKRSYLLGVAMAILVYNKRFLAKKAQDDIDWFMNAVDEALYKGQPVPPLPDHEKFSSK